MRGMPNDGEKNPDADKLSELRDMEAKVRRLRRRRNPCDQGRAVLEKAKCGQDQYKEHREKLGLMKAELDAIHAERNAHKAKRDAINQQLRDLFSQVKGAVANTVKRSLLRQNTPNSSIKSTISRSNFKPRPPVPRRKKKPWSASSE